MGSKFDQFLAEQMQDPAFKEAFDDAQERSDLLQHLTELRKSSKISQSAVGASMGVGQSTVSELETALEADPRLSTVQRYARAIGVRLCWGTAANEGGATVDAFVSRTGAVEVQYQATTIQWLVDGKVPWPKSDRAQFAQAA